MHIFKGLASLLPHSVQLFYRALTPTIEAVFYKSFDPAPCTPMREVDPARSPAVLTVFARQRRRVLDPLLAAPFAVSADVVQPM